MSEQRKNGRMHDIIAGLVEAGEARGVVTAVSRGGEMQVDAIGEGICPDSIFRIASMTKPVVAVAAMMLVEECRIQLDTPVDRWLPELADRKVLRSLESEIDDTVPTERPITLRDVLTFRLGHGILMARSGTYPIQAAIEDLFGQPGPPKPLNYVEPDEWMRRVGTLPLLHQPGERWLYHTGSEILGVLISRIAGQSLGDFLQERIFDPLGMKDTGFYVSGEKVKRLTTSYWTNYQTGKHEVFDEAEGGHWTSPPPFPSGGGGLLSTAHDFIAFGQMMLRGGAPLLSRPSVELMTHNHLTAEQQADAVAILGPSRGWGFGLAVVNRRDGFPNIGSYGWDGGLGTSWANDPKESLVGVVLTNEAFGSPTPPAVIDAFWTSTYANIVG